MSDARRIKVLGADGQEYELMIDPMTHALVMIGYPHKELHGGDMFRCNAVDTTMTLIGDTLILAFKTPASGSTPHLVTQFITNGDAHLDVVEGLTWTNQTGSQQPIYNKNRRSSLTSGLLEDTGGASFTATENMILNPTGLSGGTVIDPSYTFGEKEKVEAGGGDRDEWILNLDTLYAIKLTSDTDNNAGQIKLTYYESGISLV